MTGLAVPAQRWEGAYQSHEFQPQNNGTLTNAATCFDGLSTSCKTMLATLEDARLPSWTGSAGDAYRTFLTTLENNLEDIDVAVRAAATATRLSNEAIQKVQPQAQAAADDANKAQTTHKKTDILDQMLSAVQMDIALSEGARAINAVLSALEDLVSGLRTPDATLSDLRLPPTPGSTDPVLQTVFRGVAAAEAKLGQDAKAINALTAVEFDLLFGGSHAAVTTLRGLSAAERAWVLDHLTEAQAAALLSGLDSVKNRADYDFIAQHASLDVLDRMADVDPNHYWQPTYEPPGTGLYYGRPGEQLGGPDATTTALHQGGLGDCHLLASLAALETAQPGFLNHHITPNTNGTYTVQLFNKDGSPLNVTVTPDVPYNASGNPAYAASSAGNIDAYQIYEKAVAQSRGEIDLNGNPGYQNESGGWPQTDLPYLTGHGATSTSAGQVTADQIQAGIDSHQPVTVTTDLSGKDNSSLYDSKQPQYLIRGHVFYVTDIDRSVNPPMVTMQNPWGSNSPGSGTVTVPLDEIQQHTDSVQVGK